MSRRDDFKPETVRLLAARVGYRCSNPNCRSTTSGPALYSHKSVNFGVAAHIKAASPGGPRYDPSQPNEERSHYSNGIWLCQNHARQIDVDPERFPISLLLEWKTDAENLAFRELGRQAVSSESEMAISTAAERLGGDSIVFVGETAVSHAEIIDPDLKDGWPPSSFVEGFAVRSSIRKREELSRVVVEYLQATVYESFPVPSYEPLYQARPTHSSLYYIELDQNTSGKLRTFRSTRYYEETGPGTASERLPQTFILDNSDPVQIVVRLNARISGMYRVSIEAILTAGSKTETHTLMQPQLVVFEKSEHEQ